MMSEKMLRNAPFTGVNYAHRGLFEKDQSIPENSLPAFRRARELGYGAELDVQLSKDGYVVVFHDDTLERMTGVEGRVDAYTLDELRTFRLKGTDETIPLFTEVLEAFQGGGPLVVELKTGPRNDELCLKTMDILKSYKGLFCIESFDPRILLWFKKNAPGVVRGQLATGKEAYRVAFRAPLPFLLSRCMLNVATKPDFIAYDVSVKRPGSVLRARKKGTALFAWTAHDPSWEKTNDSVIFEHYRPETRF